MAGVSCTSSTAFEENTRIKVTLDLPPASEDAEPIRIVTEGAVVRCEPLRRGAARRRYQLGIFFLEMPEEARGHLAAFLRDRVPQ